MICLFPLQFSEEMMGNPELVPEVDVNSLQPLLSQDVVDDLLNTYMSTLTVSSNSTFTALWKVSCPDCLLGNRV